MTALHEPILTKVAPADDAAAASDPTRPVPVVFPGRWVGGAVGAFASLVVGAILWLIPRVVGRPESWTADDLLGAAATVAFLGIPIAFVLGRHLAPIARGDGWRSAAGAALTFALLAPPLGDIEILGGVGLAPWTTGPSTGALEALAGGIVIGAFGLVLCYVALPVTAAVAAVWILLVRLLPADLPARLAMPAHFSRVGVRHVVYLVLAWLVVAWTAWTIVRPPVANPW